ncbi:tripeptidyl peptidase A [Phanerochaete sordida]|uniref:tripeptidyl-peptidase II n=1 Tax=Phanerochaete sordida TaxID=48140 RepID=A0A9P3FWS8_9APHY|nr:tripeptidyl peptidase A [Phanerochaete sordida]
MRVSLKTWVVLALAGLTAAAPSVHTVKVKETTRVPRGWTKRDKAPRDLLIDLRIAIPQSNFPALEQHLWEISDPFNERYGAHLSHEEVNELIAPHPESVGAVDAWLAEHGLTEADIARSPAGDWVKVRVPVGKVENMLDATYHVYEHADGSTLVRTTSYGLPEHLHAHVEFIQPTTLFSRFRPNKATFHFSQAVSAAPAEENAPAISVPSASGGSVDASCNTNITVTCLKQLYNAVGYTPLANTGNQVAATGYLEEFASFSDLQLFFKSQVPAAVNSSFNVISINGGLNNQTEPGGEANLDTQFLFGITHPIPATFFTTGGRPPFIPDIGSTENTNEPYLDWLDFILNTPHPPQTISTSYADDEQTVPVNFAQRVCQGFAQLGAKGVSLTFSSGDGGVGDGDPDPATQECITNDGRNKTEFLPLFPPSCPFVTAVGGTIHVPETAVDFSGGGFSNVFDRPLFQAVAVPEFLEKLAPGTFKGLFNPNGRAIPDVAAQADNFLVFIDGEEFHIGGTSAAAPTFAGFVSLLNDARIRAGKSSLGFLNPLIYSIGLVHTGAFNDITTGNNPGCGTEGFNATAGWDPVTGFGTPNFGILKEIVLALP